MREPSEYRDVFIHETAVIDKGARIGCGTKIWHFTHVSAGSCIGERCNLGQNVYVASSAVIGDDCKIQNNVSLYDGVVLKDGVFCGPSCVFTNDYFPRAQSETDWTIMSTVVEEGASIGANATIVCGNTIGSYALVAAGAVVTQDVPAHALVVGVPAKRIGWVCRCGGRAQKVNTDEYTCLTCGESFRL